MAVLCGSTFALWGRGIGALALQEASPDFTWGPVTSFGPTSLPLSRTEKARWALAEEEEEPRTDLFIRGTTKLVVCGVAVIAAIVSYRHAYAVVTDYGESGITAIMIPLTIDGLVYAASMVILHAARVGAKSPPLAWMLLWLGITATLAANVAHGWQNGVVGSIVAAWPAVALVGCYEMFMWLVRTSSKPTVVEPKEKVDIDQLAVRTYKESARIGSPLSERKLAEKYGKSRRWARSIIEMSGKQEGS